MQDALWIAVVDDDPSVRKALTKLLRVRGFQARTYASARKFLAALPESMPHCLILDYQMPEMTGLELLQDMTRKGVDIPTIVITANNDLRVQERCISAGAIAYLLKPIQDAALIAAVSEASKARHIWLKGRSDHTRRAMPAGGAVGSILHYLGQCGLHTIDTTDLEYWPFVQYRSGGSRH